MPLVTLLIAASATLASPVASPWEREVVYQVFPRSFRDSNGDRIGDIRGITQKLGYLKSLGVTTLLINPIFASRMYHNYFADDFMRVDPEYGTNADFFALVRAAHRRKMKVLLDMEVQYVADRHPWYLAWKRDTNSPTPRHLWESPSIFTRGPLPLYDGTTVSAAAVDMDSPAVRDYMRRLFRYWVAPNGDADAGVDGFRLDHMMDDLDNVGAKKNLLANFWLPLVADVRRVKPSAFFVGEQADWGFGGDLLRRGGADAVYAIPLRFSLVERDRAKILGALRLTNEATPTGKAQLVFIENHDVGRYATAAGRDPRLLRLGAFLNFTLKGIPALYYGQEIGLAGKQGQWGTDGNDIPVRLAHRWNRTLDAPGTATWYRDTGPWWSLEFSRDNDGVSVEEQDRDPDSLLNFYRKLIRLRKRHSAFQEGGQTVLDLGNPSVLAFRREKDGAAVVVAVNLTDRPQSVALPMGKVLFGQRGASMGAYGHVAIEISRTSRRSPVIPSEAVGPDRRH